MTRASRLMKNTLSISLGSILMRAIGLYLQIYIASVISAEVLGVFGIISSAYMIFVTLSLSGIRFCVTRVVAQEVSRGSEYPKRLMQGAFLYSIFFGVTSLFSMWGLSGFIAEKWIGASEALVPLKILSLSLPFIPINAAVEGYFTAKQKVKRIVIAEIFDQIIKIAFIMVAFSFFSGKIKNPCSALVASTTFGEIVSAIILLILYYGEAWKKKTDSYGKMSDITKTAFPLAVSSYMRTGLSSLGHMLIPRGLTMGGMQKNGAFVTYGIIHQMALPVLMFPSAILSALGEVLIPRLTEAQTQNKKVGISYIVNRAMRIGAIFSFSVAGYMFFYSQNLGEIIYKNAEAGYYIKLMAPLIPIIYCDCVTDGCLKGLGQQLKCMIYNILEAVINIALLMLLLPRIAILGYLITMYVKEIFNFVLSFRRLTKITTVEIDGAALLSVVLASFGAKLLCTFVTSSQSLVVLTALYFVFYSFIIYISNSITRSDLKWIFEALK